MFFAVDLIHDLIPVRDFYGRLWINHRTCRKCVETARHMVTIPCDDDVVDDGSEATGGQQWARRNTCIKDVCLEHGLFIYSSEPKQQ